jgi:hypothetical protein
MCAFYAWLEQALADPARAEPITELTIDEKLSAERAQRPGFKGLSFNTIAAFNANGAMPHYRATPESHATIKGDGLLLIDSGAQYLGGHHRHHARLADRRMSPTSTSATTRWCSRARWRCRASAFRAARSRR